MAVIRAFYNAGMTLTVKLPAGDITLPPAALESLVKTDAAFVRIEAAPVLLEELTAMQAAQVRGYGQVVDVNVYAGEDKIDIPMTISLPYMLKDGEDPAAVCVWHLDDEGNLARLSGVYNELTGRIAFGVSHQSYYVAGYDPVAMWENIFYDVSKGDWYYDAVAFTNYYGLMCGYGDGTFAPQDSVTRAMFITLLWNMEGKPEPLNGLNLVDISGDAWYRPAASWGVENGIIFPVSEGVFAPDAPIYRQDMAVVFMNYANYKGYAMPENRPLPNYLDYNQIDMWAETAARKLSEAGVMSGSDGEFSPHKTATRAELAQMFKNFLRFIMGR
jgi:hypothetical protein